SAAAIVWPLWRGAGRDAASGRTAAMVTAAVVVVGGSAIYAWSSRWDWPETAGAETPAAMVSKLARRLEKEPEDLAGWLMLGRSQTALGQYPLAVRAYQRADRLEGGRNAEAVLGMAEAMMLQAEGKMDDRSARLFERALELDPAWGRAQFFGALAAQRRGDVPLAIARFESMLVAQPPEDVRRIIEEQIAVLRAGPDGATASAAATTPAQPAAGEPRISVAVSVAPALASRVTPGATLFVFVRAPGRPGPPLTVKRLPAVLPTSVTLTAADSMVPGLSFAEGDAVEVSAKVSADGSATPKAGDPIGSVRHTVGKGGTLALVIDGLTP
ncbi:MAG: tetratricopeptide repeat protein, partial [Gammaproteobacteria bacterium]